MKVCPSCGQVFEEIFRGQRLPRNSRKHGKGQCPFCNFKGKVKKFEDVGGGR